MGSINVPLFPLADPWTVVIDGVTYSTIGADAQGRLFVAGRAATTLSNAGVSVGASSTAILAANADRVYAVIVNDSDEAVYLALGEAAVMNAGVRLNANGLGTFELNATNPFVGVINGICASGSKNVTVVEGEA
jgi:hypothetical protein